MNKAIQEIQLQTSINSTKKNNICNLTGNILLLSDRLSFLAIELRKYIEESTDAMVIGLISTKQELESIKDIEIDYLIIAGYLEKKESYDIVKTLRLTNDSLKTVQWSILDEYIGNLGCQYNIKFQFDRFEPLSEFIFYLYQIKDLCDSNIDAVVNTYIQDIFSFIKEIMETARYTDSRIILQIENVDISLCRNTYAVLEHPYDATRSKITKMAIKEYLQNSRYTSYFNNEEKINTFSLLQQDSRHSMMTIEEMHNYYDATLELLYKLDAFIISIINAE